MGNNFQIVGMHETGKYRQWQVVITQGSENRVKMCGISLTFSKEVHPSISRQTPQASFQRLTWTASSSLMFVGHWWVLLQGPHFSPFFYNSVIGTEACLNFLQRLERIWSNTSSPVLLLGGFVDVFGRLDAISDEDPVRPFDASTIWAFFFEFLLEEEHHFSAEIFFSQLLSKLLCNCARRALSPSSATWPTSSTGEESEHIWFSDSPQLTTFVISFVGWIFKSWDLRGTWEEAVVGY